MGQVLWLNRNDLPPGKIMSVRRMARQGCNAKQIIAALDLDMREEILRRRCKELEIKLYGKGKSHVRA